MIMDDEVMKISIHEIYCHKPVFRSDLLNDTGYSEHFESKSPQRFIQYSKIYNRMKSTILFRNNEVTAVKTLNPSPD